MEFSKYTKARSKAGNDKNKVYIVKEVDERYVVLEDETGKIVKKNRKHIQFIK